LAALFRLPPEALENGKGFKIVDPPGSVIGASPMSYEQIRYLQLSMPELGVGKILQVDTAASESDLVQLRAAISAIREAHKQGRQVWVILGDPLKPPAQK
jgi:poly(3-hydroxyalkanoate) synthetase